MAKFVDGFGIPCENFFKWFFFLFFVWRFSARSHFHIRLITALIAKHKPIFATVGDKHKLVSNLSAHNTAVGLHRDEVFKPDAPIYSHICVIHLFVIRIQIFLRSVERVGVLHQKLPNANKPTARTRLVTVFGLNLVYHTRQFVVAFNGVHHHMHRRLFVRHSKKHIVPVPVFKAQKFVLD